MNSKPPLGVPDLKLSGDMHSEMVVENQGDDFYFGSANPVTQYLVPKYGEIFGLAPKSKAKYIKDNFYPKFMDKIRALLSL